MKSFILVTIFNCVLCQLEEGYLSPVPDKCLGTTEMLYKNCCVFPPFFTREVAKDCGGVMEVLFMDTKHNVTGYRRRAYDCDYWRCVLDRYSLLDSYGAVDDAKFYEHLDLWVSLNPVFSDAMADAKAFCKETVRAYLPLDPCEFFHLQGCVRNYLNVECPVVIPTKDCNEKKEFYRECREYYHRK
ncbi:uncharacterized protein LOC110373114 [Helicoverpa armigera]|uniref:uncharacterized protein LOC110373114 n=1 Tax=Helicoverpa armigera TaxID=29058 RepID=UPI000B38D00E|nr:uncharacterized protein LOC110373114 [Helicoverpa armigera]XP_047025401.1 uncharacterized protein LOC124634044 [Helicoverpa zea]PZC86797.1 hypothetical protein B5X24_HaOG201656 [Helicoverpa armigera]